MSTNSGIVVHETTLDNARISECVGCAESTIWNYIHEMLPYIRAELPASLLEQWRTECSGVEQAELERWLAELPEGELLVDTWEQPIPRPKDNQKQEQYWLCCMNNL